MSDMSNMSRDEFLRKYKDIRQAAFEAEVRREQAQEEAKARINADMEYIAMMTGVNMSQDDEDEEEETNGTDNTAQ